MISGKKMLVVGAHAADYVWRSGGTIAKYIMRGAEVHVTCLSFGVRGESNDLWKQPGQTAEKVKKIRLAESLAAGKALGLTEDKLEYWDIEDYPFNLTREHLDSLVVKIRNVAPDIIITHDKSDIMNMDHDNTYRFVRQACLTATSAGAEYPETKHVKQMRLFGFEPHQTELSAYVPGSFVDITESYETKISAMKCFQAQSHLIEYYTQRAFMRGNHSRRLSGNAAYKYAESFANILPVAGEELY